MKKKKTRTRPTNIVRLFWGNDVRGESNIVKFPVIQRSISMAGTGRIPDVEEPKNRTPSSTYIHCFIGNRVSRESSSSSRLLLFWKDSSVCGRMGRKQKSGEEYNGTLKKKLATRRTHPSIRFLLSLSLLYPSVPSFSFLELIVVDE